MSDRPTLISQPPLDDEFVDQLLELDESKQFEFKRIAGPVPLWTLPRENVGGHPILVLFIKRPWHNRFLSLGRKIYVGIFLNWNLIS